MILTPEEQKHLYTLIKCIKDLMGDNRIRLPDLLTYYMVTKNDSLLHRAIKNVICAGSINCSSHLGRLYIDICLPRTTKAMTNTHRIVPVTCGKMYGLLNIDESILYVMSTDSEDVYSPSYVAERLTNAVDLGFIHYMIFDSVLAECNNDRTFVSENIISNIIKFKDDVQSNTVVPAPFIKVDTNRILDVVDYYTINYIRRGIESSDTPDAYFSTLDKNWYRPNLIKCIINNSRVILDDELKIRIKSTKDILYYMPKVTTPIVSFVLTDINATVLIDLTIDDINIPQLNTSKYKYVVLDMIDKLKSYL